MGMGMGMGMSSTCRQTPMPSYPLLHPLRSHLRAGRGPGSLRQVQRRHRSRAARFGAGGYGYSTH